MDLNEKELKKEQLINDLIATVTVMDEIYNYHPDNPNKKDVVAEYNTLLKIKTELEKEIEDLNI